jgi:hypothetical protein
MDWQNLAKNFLENVNAKNALVGNLMVPVTGYVVVSAATSLLSANDAKNANNNNRTELIHRNFSRESSPDLGD